MVRRVRIGAGAQQLVHQNDFALRRRVAQRGIADAVLAVDVDRRFLDLDAVGYDARRRRHPVVGEARLHLRGVAGIPEIDPLDREQPAAVRVHRGLESTRAVRIEAPSARTDALAERDRRQAGPGHEQIPAVSAWRLVDQTSVHVQPVRFDLPIDQYPPAAGFVVEMRRGPPRLRRIDEPTVADRRQPRSTASGRRDQNRRRQNRAHHCSSHSGQSTLYCRRMTRIRSVETPAACAAAL